MGGVSNRTERGLDGRAAKLYWIPPGRVEGGREQPDALMPNARGEHEQGGMGKKGKKERNTVGISYNDIWKTPSGQI